MKEHILSRKIQLSDGSFENIFSKSPLELNKVIRFNCHLCRVGNLLGEYILSIHINGKKHIKNLKSAPNAVAYRKPLEPKVDGEFW